MKRILVALISALTLAQAALADEMISQGDLVLTNPVARATPPAAKVGGGYLTITNNGAEADRLISVEAEFAGMNQVHEMAMEEGIMKMTHLENGLEIPAGEIVKLKPGGFHLMFMQLKEPLTEGETRKVKLTFEKAGSVELDFTVKSLEDTLKIN